MRLHVCNMRRGLSAMHDFVQDAGGRMHVLSLRTTCQQGDSRPTLQLLVQLPAHGGQTPTAAANR